MGQSAFALSGQRIPRQAIVQGVSIIVARALLALAAAVAAAGAAPAPTDPYEIFARARHAWEAQRYPERTAYVVAVTVVENGKAKTEHYRAGYDTASDAVWIDAVSDYERAHPFYPHGINFGSPFGNGAAVNPDEDYLGVPVLAPNYSFGLGRSHAAPKATMTPAEIVRAVREQFHDPAPPQKQLPTPKPEPTLREIGYVATQSHAYDIVLLGIEALDGVRAYHLALHPRTDPGRYRLRELWIDVTTFAPVRLVEGLNFVTGPGTMVPWAVTFARVGGATYIRDESALAPMRLKRHRYTAAHVAFENIHPVDSFFGDLSEFVPEESLLMEEP